MHHLKAEKKEYLKNDRSQNEIAKGKNVGREEEREEKNENGRKCIRNLIKHFISVVSEK